MTPTRWIIFALVAVVALVGLVTFAKKDAIDVSAVDAYSVISNESFKDHVFGKKDSKVVLIEYADFQCPGCGGAHPQLKQLVERYKDKIAFVYRAFPLTSIHPNALAAAAVAEAASNQGKFWEMHDLLFESQSSWENLKADERGAVFSGYARQLGLNVDTFNRDVASKEVSDRIAYARAIGGKINVNSTPTIYVGKDLISDDVRNDLIQQKGDKLKTQLDAALKAVGETPPVTTPEQ
jgi:protein-disulfide isomerase